MSPGRYDTLLWPRQEFLFAGESREVLSRSGHPHYAVMTSVAFYSVGFEGFIEPSRYENIMCP